MQQIAVLGTGAMGSRLAQNLMQAGYAVTVYNRTRERADSLVDQGATYAATPRAAAEGADVVISMVRDDAVSRQVWLAEETGVVRGLGEGAIAIEASTLTVSWIESLAQSLADQGISCLAAPVVGSRPQAEAQRLIGLVGGELDVLSQVQDVLSAAGIAAVHPIGSVGQAMAMKLAVNVLFGTQVAALAEMLTLLSKSGLQADQALETLGQLPITSPAMQGAGGLMLKPHHAPLFPIELVEKDFRYAVESVDATRSVCAAVQSIYRQAMTQGYGGDNITGIIQLFS